MSNKDWFVIHDGHHIGPFSKNEIRQMIDNQHLNMAQLTWKSGMSKWVSIENMLQEKANSIKAVSSVPNIPPKPKIEVKEKVELPPLPDLEKEDLLSKKAEEPEALAEEVIKEELVPPPVPNLELTPLEKMKLEIKKIQNKDVFEDASEEVKVKQSEDFEIRLIPAFLVLVLLSTAGYFVYQKMFPKIKGLAGLSPNDRAAISRVYDQPLSKGLFFRYALSKKSDGLWITSNFKRKTKLKVYMQNIKGQILGEGPIKLSANAIMDNGLAYITKWKIDKGFKVPYGKYLVSVSGEKLESRPFFVKYLPFLKKLFPEVKHNIADRGNEILFYPNEIVKFEEELKKYQYKVKKNVLGPLKDQIQRYQSFLGMLNQINTLYKSILKKARRGKDMLIFENKYNQDIGPLLRDLILDCNRQHLSYFNIDPKRAKIFDQLVEYGKEVGEIAANIAKETTSYKKLRKKNRIALAKKYDEKILEVKLKGEGVVESLTEKIAEFQ